MVGAARALAAQFRSEAADSLLKGDMGIGLGEEADQVLAQGGVGAHQASLAFYGFFTCGYTVLTLHALGSGPHKWDSQRIENDARNLSEPPCRRGSSWTIVNQVTFL